MNRDEILNASDLATETFDVPKWGSVTIRELTGEQREQIETAVKSMGKQSVRALAAVHSMIDADGKPVFRVSDVSALAKKSGVALDAVFGRVVKLNAMDKSEVEAIAGNSETIPPDASGSS